MAKKSKGFGNLSNPQKKVSKSSKPSPLPFVIKSVDLEAIGGKSEADYDAQEERIGKILGTDEEGNIDSVSKATLAKYRRYLEQNLDRPCIMTGSEDFPWEERYILGYGSKQEHSKLRQNKASYLDTFELLALNDYINPFDGLTVKVKRLEDQKEFNLSLSYLKATDKNSKNYQLLEDYSFWQVNWY